MVDYYRLRYMVISDIDKMLSNKIPVDEIKFAITSKYGMTGKIVDERIGQHLKRKKLKKKVIK